VDVVVTRLNDVPLLLRNTTKTESHWLRLRLRGRRSNRDGIGARVRVDMGAGWQWNRVTTSVGFAGSSEPVAHFGLGNESGPRAVEIHWPSGTRQVLESVASDQCLIVAEPDASTASADLVRPCRSEPVPSRDPS
jgi:hypothetical protein